MIDKHNQKEEYMTGWEIIGATIIFALLITTTFLILIIGGGYGN